MFKYLERIAVALEHQIELNERIFGVQLICVEIYKEELEILRQSLNIKLEERNELKEFQEAKIKLEDTIKNNFEDKINEIVGKGRIIYEFTK